MKYKTEDLFTAETALRTRARQLDACNRPGAIDQDQARKNLRAAAMHYARVSKAIDDE